MLGEHSYDDEKSSDEGGDNPRTRGNHSKDAIKILKAWLFSPQHMYHPYPTDKEKEELMDQTGLTKKQLSNWFTNSRKRVLQPKYDSVCCSLKRRRFGMFRGMPMAPGAAVLQPQVPMSMDAAQAAFAELTNNAETTPAAERTLAIADIIASLAIASAPRVIWDKEGKASGIFIPVTGHSNVTTQSIAPPPQSIEIPPGSTISPALSPIDTRQELSSPKASRRIQVLDFPEEIEAAVSDLPTTSTDTSTHKLSAEEYHTDDIADLENVFDSEIFGNTVPDESEWDLGLSSYSTLGITW